MSKTNGATAAEMTTQRFANIREIVDWSHPEWMCGAYEPHKYDKVIVRLLVVRRLDCLLGQMKANSSRASASYSTERRCSRATQAAARARFGAASSRMICHEIRTAKCDAAI